MEIISYALPLIAIYATSGLLRPIRRKRKARGTKPGPYQIVK